MASGKTLHLTHLCLHYTLLGQGEGGVRHHRLRDGDRQARCAVRGAPQHAPVTGGILSGSNYTSVALHNTELNRSPGGRAATGSAVCVFFSSPRLTSRV